jgi:hypothetical protein
MADDEVPTETPAGGTGFQLPDAPGDFSETVPNKATAKPGKMADPFTPLTPEQERTERARLNFQQGFRGTLAGSALAADAARGAEGFTPEEQAKMPGEIAGAQAAIGAELPAIDSGGINFDAAQETAKDELQKIQADQMAYKNMPAYHGVVEGAFSLAGQLGGMSLSPENLVFPQARIGSTAWRRAPSKASPIPSCRPTKYARRCARNLIRSRHRWRSPSGLPSAAGWRRSRTAPPGCTATAGTRWKTT